MYVYITAGQSVLLYPSAPYSLEKGYLSELGI